MGRAYFPIGKLKAALACVYFGFLTTSILPHSGGFFNAFCERYYLCIKTRYTLSYLREEIRPGSIPRSGPYFACQLLPLWDSSLLTGGAPPVFLRGPDGDPGSPSRPAPSVGMGAARHPGPSGPQPPRRPLPPAPTQNAPFAQVAPQPVSGGFTPRKRSAFCASAGACLGLGGPLAFAPGG